MDLYQSSVLSGSGGGVDEDGGDGVEDKQGKDKVDAGSRVLEALGTTLLPATQFTVRHLVDLAVAEASSSSPGSQAITMATNALEAILRLVPPRDVIRLQENVHRFAPAYHYYSHNSSQVANPLVDKVLPTGGAITHMAAQLSALKRRGIQVIAQKCKEERAQTHEYVGTYPCDKEGGGPAAGSAGKPKKKGGGGGGGGKKKGGGGGGKKNKKQKRKKTSVNADKDDDKNSVERI
jgi:uncharacterized membrane protein YgcG